MNPKPTPMKRLASKLTPAARLLSTACRDGFHDHGEPRNGDECQMRRCSCYCHQTKGTNR